MELPTPSPPVDWKKKASPPRGERNRSPPKGGVNLKGKTLGSGDERPSDDAAAPRDLLGEAMRAEKAASVIEEGGGKPSAIPEATGKKRRMESSPLGRTSGVLAAGAWAARMEIATLLESGCDTSSLVDLIKQGKEGDHVLSLVGGSVQSSAGSWSVIGREQADAEATEEDRNSLFPSGDEELESELEKQAAILNSLARALSCQLDHWDRGVHQVRRL